MTGRKTRTELMGVEDRQRKSKNVTSAAFRKFPSILAYQTASSIVSESMQVFANDSCDGCQWQKLEHFTELLMPAV